MQVFALVVLASAVAEAKPLAHPDAPIHAWIGVFQPSPRTAPCDDCTRPTVVGVPGEVIVLTPGDGRPLPDAGEVALVQPLLGMNVIAHLTPHGRARVPLFAADRRRRRRCRAGAAR